MKSFFNITYLFGCILLFIQVIYAKNSKKLSKAKQSISNDDEYYLIFVKNQFSEYRVFTDAKTTNQKREESSIFIESLLDELNTLIIDNKDTYKHPEVLEEMEEKSQLRKRSIEEGELTYHYDASDVIFPISSVNDTVVFYAYLSKKLAQEIAKKPNVEACEPDTFAKYNEDNYYNEKDILKETGWKELMVRKPGDYHLSILSQGKHDNTIVNSYDHNYYYPKSAGRGANIVVIDSNFDFTHPEFTENDGTRTVQCIGEIIDGKFSKNDGPKCGNSKDYHGKVVSDIAAGYNHGVAPNANVYGIAVPINSKGNIGNSHILSALQIVYQTMNCKNLVVNLSFGTTVAKESSTYKQYSKVISSIKEKGGIVVASSGNGGKKLRSDSAKLDIPCQLSDVICVGGTDNNPEISVDNAYKIAKDSNYGDGVNIYAPYYTIAEMIDSGSGQHIMVGANGTSFSCPLISGLIATIIGEHPNNNNVQIIDQLIKQGEVVYYEGIKSYVANNGKHIVYSPDGKYKGCGIYSGNLPCTTTTPKKNNYYNYYHYQKNDHYYHYKKDHHYS